VDLWFGHHFLGFDAPVVNRLLRPDLIPLDRVIDTLVVSRLVEYDRYIPKGCDSAHSLEAHGRRLKKFKGKFNKFDEYSQEMVDYWEQDLDVTLALFEDFKPYIYDPQWKKSMRVEHDLQISLDQQSRYGFLFDKDQAETLLSTVRDEMDILEKELQDAYPPKLEHVKTINYTVRKDGQEGSHVQSNKQSYPMTKVQGDKLLCFDYVSFNPGSSKDRIEALWDAGWKPFEKTKTHQRFARSRVGQPWGKSVKKMTQEFWDDKKAHFDYYGWTVSEDNLATLPPKAPEAARKLAQWLTLEGRRSSLVEWIGQVKSDGRIHGKVWHIGAWTGRMSHSNPNTANISSVWPDGKPAKTAVEEIKKRYDTPMRACWKVPEDSWLVGVDADGIQLRILADWLWRHFDAPDHAKAIMEGKKENETDIHNVNRRALGLNHIDRDDAKTFIYAWVLNAGIPKVASILKTTTSVASGARDNFERSISGLKQLRSELLPYIAERGWFTGYDGRKVLVPSLHKTLAGILQNGEAVVMKHSTLAAEREVRLLGINAQRVGLIHDENQVEVTGTYEEALKVKEVYEDKIKWAGVDLGFKIQLLGSGSIGRNWAETH
jgi:DNA polymerase I-like protein with 3'-5' exonuclease and polymerase domains